MIQPEPVDAQPVARMRAVKAVIPAAGLATRFLPATKAVPKELLPVVDTPVLQYIVEEAAAAGIGDVLLVTGRGKTSMDDSAPLLPAMLDLQARTGGIVLAFIEVEPDQVDRYGIASVKPAELDIESDALDIVRVTGLVEKPAPDQAPSNLAVVGRYVLPATVFDAIRRIEPGSGGEIQLTDAMALMLAEGTPVHGIVYRGVRYDTGLPLGYLQAVVQIACQRRDLGPAFSQWLVDFVGKELRGVEA